jgi:hypothetical protein
VYNEAKIMQRFSLRRRKEGFIMKKSIFVLLVLMLAVPAMAENAVITVVNNADGTASINYTSDVNVRAFALDVNVSTGTITAVTDYHTGESVTGDKGYGIFLGEFGIDINDAGIVQSPGSPVASVNEPGAAGTGIGTNRVILQLGALYEDGNQPVLSGTLCKVTVSAGGTMCITEEDTYRAGVVLEDGNGTSPNLTGACGIDIVMDCFLGSPSGNPDFGDWNAFDFWKAAGEPICWCAKTWPGGDFRYQCKGDADRLFTGKDKLGKRKWVSSLDLDCFAAGWQKVETEDGFNTWRCADFAHQFTGKDKDGKRKFVTSLDLDIFAAGWQKTDTESPMMTDCDGTPAPPHGAILLE